MKQHSSELRLTGIHAIPLFAKPRRRESSPYWRPSCFPRAHDLSDGLRVLSLTFLPASDVGLRLGKLPKQARGHDGGNRMCLLQCCILCNSPRSLQVHFQTDFCNSSPQKIHFISDPNQTDFRRLFSLKDDETVYSRCFFRTVKYSIQIFKDPHLQNCFHRSDTPYIPGGTSYIIWKPAFS